MWSERGAQEVLAECGMKGVYRRKVVSFIICIGRVWSERGVQEEGGGFSYLYWQSVV